MHISPLKKNIRHLNRIHVLRLLNRRDWKQFIFKNVCTCRTFVSCYRAYYV